MTFFPAYLPLPEALHTPRFILEPLRPSHNPLDYEAVMASRAQLRRWGGHNWPADDFTAEANHDDLAMHWREHQARLAFTYTVLTPEHASCLGCVYIRPLAELQADNPATLPAISPDTALVRFWVRSDRLDGDLEATLLHALRDWFAADWPFCRVLFETRADNARQIALFAAAGLDHAHTLAIPNRGGAHVFYE